MHLKSIFQILLKNYLKFTFKNINRQFFDLLHGKSVRKVHAPSTDFMSLVSFYTP